MDKAWPFPDHDHGADACVVAFERAKSCLQSWRREERMVLAGMIVIGAVSLVGKVGGPFLFDCIRRDLFRDSSYCSYLCVGGRNYLGSMEPMFGSRVGGSIHGLSGG